MYLSYSADQHTNDLRTIRECVYQDAPIPPSVVARVEALGIDFDALIARHIENRKYEL